MKTLHSVKPYLVDLYDYILLSDIAALLAHAELLDFAKVKPIIPMNSMWHCACVSYIIYIVLVIYIAKPL